jgi:hypothetical protein
MGVHMSDQFQEYILGCGWFGPEDWAAEDCGCGTRLIARLCGKTQQFFGCQHEVDGVSACQVEHVVSQRVRQARGVDEGVEQGQGAEGRDSVLPCERAQDDVVGPGTGRRGRG